MLEIIPATHQGGHELAGRAEAIRRQLKKLTLDGAPWPRRSVVDYLRLLLRDGGVARVARSDAPLINEVIAFRLSEGGQLAGASPAACEPCGAIWTLTNPLPLHRKARGQENRTRRTVRCPQCRDEHRRKLQPVRRRENTPWHHREHADFHREPCIGCVFATTWAGPLIKTVPMGKLYCSDTCRKRVDAYLKRGGQIETTRAGQPFTLRKEISRRARS